MGMSRFLRSLGCVLLWLAAVGFALEPQEIYSVVNDVRSNPQKYADLIERDYLPHSRNKEIVRPEFPDIKINEKAAIEAIRALSQQPRMSKLRYYQSISAIMQRHTDALANQTEWPSFSSLFKTRENTTTKEELLNISLYLRSSFEFISLMPEKFTAREVILTWLISDGIESRTLRNVIFRPEFSGIGIGVTLKSSGEKSPNFILHICYVGGFICMEPCPGDSYNAQYLEKARQILDSINQFRANPLMAAAVIAQKYIRRFEISPRKRRLEDSLRPVCHWEGRPAAREAIDYLMSIAGDSLPPLTWNDGLAYVAQKHAKWLRENQTWPVNPHIGFNDSTWEQRVEEAVEYNGDIFEGISVSRGHSPSDDIVLQWIVDDGISSRRHRRTIFSSKYRYLGAGLTFRETHRKDVGVFLFGEEVFCKTKECPKPEHL